MSKLLSNLNAELKAYKDPVFFCQHFLHIDPYPVQKEILREFYCTEPADKYTHMILVCGMRSGKTELGAMASSYELFKLIMKGDPQKYYGLPPNQPIYIMHVANSRDQANQTVFAQTAGLLENAEWFVDHGLTERANEFSFPKYSLHLVCEHSNSASLAGRTAKAVVLDETARFKDNSGKFSGEAVYYTVSRAVKTFGKEGKVFSVSSPIFVDDFQMRLYKSGMKLDNFLCYKKPTWEMNPRFTFESLKHEFDLNPETAWRDYGARPSAAVEAYFKAADRVDAAFDDSLPVIIEENSLIDGIIPKKGANYYFAGDPAVRNDAFGLALIHSDGPNIVADFVLRFTQEGKEEIDAFAVKAFILSVANTFPVRSFIVDTWQYPETIQALERAGILVKQHTVKKQEYDCLKERMYTGKLKIPANEKLNDELKGLELMRGIKVDHPKTGTKDMADALANAVWELCEEMGTRPEAFRAPISPFYNSIEDLPQIESIDEVEFHELDI